jgi:hypothetical protein
MRNDQIRRLNFNRVAERTAQKIHDALDGARLGQRGWPFGHPDYIHLYRVIGRRIVELDTQ